MSQTQLRRLYLLIGMLDCSGVWIGRVSTAGKLGVWLGFGGRSTDSQITSVRGGSSSGERAPSPHVPIFLPEPPTGMGEMLHHTTAPLVIQAFVCKNRGLQSFESPRRRWSLGESQVCSTKRLRACEGRRAGVISDIKQLMGRVGRCQLCAHLQDSLERKQASKEDHPHDVTGKDTFLCYKPQRAKAVLTRLSPDTLCTFLWC